MNDLILQGFLESAARDCEAINADSPILRLVPDPVSGDPPRVYHGLLRGVDHFQRTPEGHFEVAHGPISFTVRFGDQHCRSVDPNYPFKVVRTEPRIAHPNIKGGLVCLGYGFKPSTRLRSIVQAFYLFVSGRVAATDHAFEPAAARWYLKHQDEVRGLHAPPLWRRPVANSARVETRDAPPPGTAR